MSLAAARKASVRVKGGRDSQGLTAPRVVGYLILRPLLAAWAVIFAIVFRRMQVALAQKLGPDCAALPGRDGDRAPSVVLIPTVAHEAPQAVPTSGMPRALLLRSSGERGMR